MALRIPRKVYKADLINLYAVHERAEGYPRLAGLLDSDDNFMIYRRFGFLSTRLLLDKQDELRLLEEELDEIDKYDAKDFPVRHKTRNLSEEDARERRDLLGKIKKEYCEYGTFQIFR